VEAAVPLTRLGKTRIFFCAQTMRGFIHANQAVWQVLSLTEAGNAEQEEIPPALISE
jgi:hypothetical protein